MRRTFRLCDIPIADMKVTLNSPAVTTMPSLLTSPTNIDQLQKAYEVGFTGFRVTPNNLLLLKRHLFVDSLFLYSACSGYDEAAAAAKELGRPFDVVSVPIQSFHSIVNGDPANRPTKWQHVAKCVGVTGGGKPELESVLKGVKTENGDLPPVCHSVGIYPSHQQNLLRSYHALSSVATVSIDPWGPQRDDLHDFFNSGGRYFGHPTRILIGVWLMQTGAVMVLEPESVKEIEKFSKAFVGMVPPHFLAAMTAFGNVVKKIP
eukprot:PhF_6_TR7212/c0_g1_i1/m.10778